MIVLIWVIKAREFELLYLIHNFSFVFEIAIASVLEFLTLIRVQNSIIGFLDLATKLIVIIFLFLVIELLHLNVLSLLSSKESMSLFNLTHTFSFFNEWTLYFDYLALI